MAWNPTFSFRTISYPISKCSDFSWEQDNQQKIANSSQRTRIIAGKSDTLTSQLYRDGGHSFQSSHLIGPHRKQACAIAVMSAFVIQKFRFVLMPFIYMI